MQEREEQAEFPTPFFTERPPDDHGTLNPNPRGHATPRAFSTEIIYDLRAPLSLKEIIYDLRAPWVFPPFLPNDDEQRLLTRCSDEPSRSSLDGPAARAWRQPLQPARCTPLAATWARISLFFSHVPLTLGGGHAGRLNAYNSDRRLLWGENKLLMSNNKSVLFLFWCCWLMKG